MNEELHKHTLHLRAGDFDALRELHPDLTPSHVIRRVVSNHVDSLRRAREGVAAKLESQDD